MLRGGEMPVASRLLVITLMVAVALYHTRADGGTNQMQMSVSVFQSHSMSLPLELKEIQEALNLKAGDTYGEIGGGSGLFFAEIAKNIMPGGHAYGTGKTEAETSAMLAAATAAGIHDDVSVFVGQPLKTGLPAACCDVIVLRIVYHMLSAPEAYLNDLRVSLKPGGRLLVLEHTPNLPVTSRKNAAVDMLMMGNMMHMAVVPSAALIVEAMSAGYEVEAEAFPAGIVQPWPYFNIPGQYANDADTGGYAILFRNPTAPLPLANWVEHLA